MISLQHSYRELPAPLFASTIPQYFSTPTPCLINDTLAKELGLPHDENLLSLLHGNQNSSLVIAQAYSGHQYGHYNRLGDGRAALIGEIKTSQNKILDIHLKGSGRTAFSRNGDGKATLNAMLREYLISEAMAALAIPTTRSLLVATTGENIFRDQERIGAVLARVASSHIRVGTFQLASEFGETIVRSLADYTIARHYSNCQISDNPYLCLFNQVKQKQIALIIDWLRVGFIHGVMNTDNMLLCGETVDYGPCAFMDEYHPQTVFSSIDSYGRYAFGQQPQIAKWNLSKFAETLVPLVDTNQEKAISALQIALDSFDLEFNQAWITMMSKKLGLAEATIDQTELLELITSLLTIMQEQSMDYTNTFALLTYPNTSTAKIDQNKEFNQWYKNWKNKTDSLAVVSQSQMQQNNPVYIPRNHLVEYALTQAEKGNVAAVTQLRSILTSPYQIQDINPNYQSPPTPSERIQNTYCGT
ncbi:MAG: YdiU family protein [Methylacidiphilales bacterium]|nr:YdiU family protein [Candidatus Methylacidiphilales bacterium]